MKYSWTHVIDLNSYNSNPCNSKNHTEQIFQSYVEILIVQFKFSKFLNQDKQDGEKKT